ncbi:PREDICTED: trichohyalin-like [Vollenhovia emeryi]|uniref:trichohyalin-like n=1 Tax=Vollenhovia emeryi TaxID=411798 RepID=UPI0005F5414E|nr:PREDICTED: trichohyalin-like [Vollenhovia emeryi]XP_011879436.1 PREDICTED: trichohyalin-like [Vollenhovia emeryi]
MQPRVTVALATVWLTVAVLIGGAVTLRLSHDQYSPASPRRHAGIQRDHTGDWRDHDPAEDQPVDLRIGSRRSISTEESEALSRNAKFTERDFPLGDLLKDIVSSKRIYPFSGWQRRLPNIVGAEFAADKVDYGYEMPETLSRETVVSPSDLLDDPFVADDTFQDQGPGSMEIYKLDLSKEKTLLTATTPSTNLPSRNKSKASKKTGHLDSKAKTTEIKSTTTDANVSHRQSNFFEEQLTETPLVNRDAFGVGGVPELQVGCEGLEASPSSHKAKRSIDTLDKEKGEVPASVLLDVTPVSLDLDDVLSYDEEEYEEMDELLKLKRLETTTKRSKPNRGDMDASHLNSDHLDEFRRPDKLPVRGDLGGSTLMNSSGFVTDQKESPKRFLMDLKIKNYEETKSKRETVSLDDDDGASRSHGRRLLWFAEANTEGFADGKGERKRTRRSIDWGFGEDEGVVSSDELQTVNERRRQHEMRYHQDTSRRRDQHRGLNADVDSIRQEYEKLLEQKRREEEQHLRQMQQANQRTLDRWEEEENRRRDEMRRRQYEEYHKKIYHTSTPRTDNEQIRRQQMEERRRQEAARNRTQEMARRNEEELRRREEEERRRQLQEEEMRKRPQTKWQEGNLRRSDSRTSSTSDEDRKRRLHDEEMKRREEERRRQLEEARRQEQHRLRQEAQRRKEDEERRRQEDRTRNLSENDRMRPEDRRREWLERRKQENENERRRQQPPSNLMRAEHPVNHPNDIRQRDQDEKRRQQEDRQLEQKLQEYIAQNRPINVNRADQRSEEERRRYRPEENRNPRMNATRNDDEYRRRVEEQRRRQEEERKLQDYIRSNQPVNVPSRDNQSTTADRNWFEERRLIEEARRRDRYPDPGVRRAHGPSAPTYIDPRSSPEQVRVRQQEAVRRLEEERRQRYEAEERRKELARRQWEEEEERRAHQERMRKEAARREEEARREQSRRYEEDRKRLELERIETERRRQEMLRERSWSEAGRARQPEATRPIYYQDPRLLAEHRRRQDSRPIPSNLMRAEEARRAAAEREKQRLEDERRQQEERMREHRQKETDQWRRQELARLNSLPVSARIIVRPGGFSPTSLQPRGSFDNDNEIDFTGINPNRKGVPVAQFPAPPTLRPPIEAPSACVWAVVHCCSANNNRLVKCFESLGCPGINWDPNPCSLPIAQAARTEVLNFYSNV